MVSDALALLSFATFLAVLAVGIAWVRNEGVRTPLARALLLVLEFPLVASFAYTFMYLTHDKAAAVFFYKLGALGWCLGPSSAAYFIYRLLVHLRRRRPHPVLVFLMFFPAPVFVYGVFTGRMIALDFTRTPAGWVETIDLYSPWTAAYVGLTMATCVLAAYALFLFLRRSPWNRHRVIARRIIAPVFLLSALALTVNVFLPSAGVSLPPLGHIFVGMFLAGFGSLILRYPILQANPRLVFDRVLQNMQDMVVVTDREARVVEANPAAEAILGHDPRSLPGTPLQDLFPEELLAAMQSPSAAAHSFLEISVKAADGRMVPCMCTLHKVYDAFEDHIGFLLMAQDIRQRKRLEEQSVTDPLTGVFNRLKAGEEMRMALDRHARTGVDLSLVFFDIDRFKKVNDVFGHAAGDAVLVGLADLVRQEIRTTDLAARWGGEEFLLLCPATSLEQAATLAERIRRKVESHSFAEIDAVTVSLGVTRALPGDTPESLVRRADEAMYDAKKAGRNRVCRR